MTALQKQQFSCSQDQLRALVADALKQARTLGADAAEVDVSEGMGLSVSVRLGEVETVEHHHDRDLGVTVLIGQQRGHASTSDFSPQALTTTVEKAVSLARYTASDAYAGLPAMADLARPPFGNLDLYHPWDLSLDQAIDLTRQCEQAALDQDTQVTNSDGASVHTQQSQFAFGNSLGFLDGYAGSSHSISCSVIAGTEARMQRDYWYSAARAAADLEAPTQVGVIAAQRTVRRLDARKIKTCKAPVLFEASLAGSLLGHLVGAASGGSLYRKSSFLQDALGQSLFPPQVNLREEPHLPKGFSSAWFDAEGVATAPRSVVKGGVLEGYFLSTYSARKLGMKTTGNAGGSHNLILDPFGGSFEDLLKTMDTGLLVTELLGHGVNPVNGDYSRGAAGFWVEHGVIQYPVEEITIAGNLLHMYRQLVAVGNDVVVRGSRITGSILIGEMTIAGD
jgi:PmbA protein